MISGYARIIIYSKTYGIEKIMEGRFDQGNLVGFGRIHAMERSVPHPNYVIE
jgi:hypothetical protein